MNRVFKAIFAFVFGILWFCFCCIGITLLVFPQLITQAYGKNVDWVDSFIDFMEDFFDSFKEL